MNFGHPLHVISSALDGDVLAVLAAGDVGLTGRDIARRAGASQEGTRRALDRLVTQGIVRREQAGRAHQYRLNREHLAAKYIERLGALRLELIENLRAVVRSWSPKPHRALLFGSVARGQSAEGSDIDILIVRPAKVDTDDASWREQIEVLEESSTAWTGNDTRVLEYGEAEYQRLRDREAVLKAALAEGIDLVR